MTKQGLFAIVFSVLLLTAAAPATASTTTKQDAGAFTVALNEDGSARVTLTLAYNLDSEEEKAAFQDLKNNETLQKQTRSEFRNRMERVAASAENETGREMAITNAAIAFETTNGGSTGLVKLSVTWKGLAATKGDRLVVTEPFASGFEPNRTFTVRGPEGYTLQSANPAPKTKSKNSAIWAAGTELTGFKVVFAPATTPTATATKTPTETTGGGGPGFGFTVTLLALLGAAAVAMRRR